MQCSKCGKTVEKYANKKNCRDCYNAYMREYSLRRYHERKLRAIIMLGGKCTWCSSESNLQFDHINRSTKEVTVSAFNTSEARFWNEVLTKCQLLCGTCHRMKSARELSVDHGGGVSGKRNCPCAPCKARKAEYMKNRKKSKTEPL